MIALITDTHFGSKNFNKSVFKSQMDWFQNQFFPYLIEHKIKDVIHLGDFVHNRNTIDLIILQDLKQNFFKWFEDNDIKLHIIVGNHDTQYKSTLEYNFYKENTIEFKNVVVYEKDTILKLGKYKIGMIPWIVETKSWTPPKGCDILCGHFEIKDFPMMKNIFSHEGYQYEIFKDYKYVFTGHYHTRSNKGNVHYIGTQYQLTWNDFDEDKGFAILKDNFEFEYIPNTYSPKFIKMYYNSTLDLPIRVEGLSNGISGYIDKERSLEIAKDNYVRVYEEKITNQSEFDFWLSSLTSVSKNDYKIETVNTQEVIEDYDINVFNETLDNDSNTIDIILNCIEGMTFEESISKETLLQMSKMLYQEAFDEAYNIGEDV